MMTTLTKSTAKMWTFRILATTVYEVVVAIFFKYFKSRLFAFAGGGGRPLHPLPLCRPGDYAKSVGVVFRKPTQY